MAPVGICCILIIHVLLIGDINPVRGLMEKKVGDWQVIYRARSRNGQSVVKSYMKLGGASEQTEKNSACVSNNGRDYCKKNYRHSMIDRWDSSGVEKVRLELYRDGQMVAHIVFNGTATTSTSWFSQDRVISSNWFDLKEPNTEEGKQFSFFGYSNNDIDRRLYINKHWKGGCSFHKGWMMVIEGLDRGNGCNYEVSLSYPVFLYNPHTYADFYDDFKREADVLVISVIAKQVNAV